MTKVFKFTHNNMGITINKPTIEHIKATFDQMMFKILVPDEKLREEMVQVFIKKLENKDYEVVEEEE